MQKTVNIYEAKTTLSQLIDRVAEGEEIIIARAGRPVARLVPLQPRCLTRRSGRLRGRIRIRRDFDAPLPRELFDSETM